MESSIYGMRHRDVLTVCVLALLSLGVIMVQSASTSLVGCVVRATIQDPDAPRSPGPSALANVTAAASSDGIDLSWDADTDPTVIGYRVYRSDSATDGYKLIETVKQPLTRWKDATAPIGDGSFYRVAGADELGREGPVAQLSITRPGQWYWTQLADRHLIYVVVSFAVFLFVGHFDYAKLLPSRQSPWKSPAIWLTVLAALACVGVLVPGVGSAVNGARRWIRLGPIQIQPSELAKWAAVLFLAWWLTRPTAQTEKFFRGFIPSIIPVGILCLLVVIQDFGTAALIALCALTMLMAGRVRWRHLAIIALPVCAAAIWFIAHKGYRLRRIMAFRDPYASPQGEGYHMIQSLLSFSTGGLFGRGLGNGIQKLGYLPEDTTDFIFAVICEELGLFGALLVIAMYVGILYVAWQTIKRPALKAIISASFSGRARPPGSRPPSSDASNDSEDFGRLLAFGIGSMLGLQAAINIAVATVSVPTKGLSLPLISAGGSGLVITCAALGLLYSVAQREQDEPVRRPQVAGAAAATTGAS